jgi:acetylornithine deacetylase/succinyl-diaminopimelate desuccinylase-like protein
MIQKTGSTGLPRGIMTRARHGFVLVVAAAILAWLSFSGGRAASLGRLDFARLSEESVRWLSEYIRIDTSNPPGREGQAAEYLAQILRREGIPARVIPTLPGRANVYARLSGRTKAGALALVHHMDVVPADPEAWSVPPFEGVFQNGHVWGRGALDAKGLGIAHLAALVAVKRSGYPLERDLVFIATADEESGGEAGLGWMIENRPNLFKGVGYALTEGGINLLRDGQLVFIGLEVTQKVPVWLRLTAAGSAGHGAVPRPEAASHRLVRALDRLLRYQWPVTLDPVVARYLKEIAPFQPPDLREIMGRPDELVKVQDLSRRLDPVHQSLLRNTLAVTLLRAGKKTNYLSDRAVAELDCRLLPSQDPEQFIHTVGQIINDPFIDLEPILIGTAASSPPEGRLFEAVRQVTQRLEPDATVGTFVLPGFSDARLLRDHGIMSYGLDPFRLKENQSAGVHGTDERIPISELDFAIRYFYEVTAELVLK